MIAAVSDVLPWSTWPIVPTLQCGFVRANFSLAIGSLRLTSLNSGQRGGGGRCAHPESELALHLILRMASLALLQIRAQIGAAWSG